MDRLGAVTARSLPTAARPPIDPGAVGVGIVHLGIGAFHRAHQAEFTQDAMAAGGDLRWGICGVTQRSAAVARQLAPQDGLYTVLTRSRASSAARVNASVRCVLSGREHRDEVIALLASPEVRVVTLTVTEKGYRHDPTTGRLRTDDPEVRADLESDRPPVSVVGQLARAIEARMRAGSRPLTVVCCDNLPDNGRTLAGLVHQFADALPDGGRVLAWMQDNVRFPATMIDRIVPATTDQDLADAARLIGVRDEGVVVTEPFRQWVLQDDFAGERPPWHEAGAVFTDDVAPYEAMKLRLLNGSHSALAYLGALAGYEHIADAMAVDAFEGYTRALMTEDTAPTLSVPAGFDLARYETELVERFHNPGLWHRTVQIAMDGSQKLPQRLLGTIRDRRSAGARPEHAALAVAAWMRFVQAGVTDEGRPLPLDDPLAGQLREATRAARSPREVVTGLLAIGDVFGAELRDDGVLVDLLSDALAALTAGGAAAAVRALSDRITT